MTESTIRKTEPTDSEARWRRRQQEWLQFVNRVIGAVESGGSIPLGPATEPITAPAAVARSTPAKKVLLCSPHPDDESLVGALPLRLRLESGAQVSNIAVTLGSNVARRAGRLRELESACRVLGFGLIVAKDSSGLERVNPESRQKQPGEWAEKVHILAEIFDRQKPDLVFAPHAEDWNTTHIGTHYLAVEALGNHLERSKRGPVPFIETEFWHEIESPNLMIGVSPENEAILLAAATEHGGEMDRNPYHLLHVGRMMDKVRRGAEVVGGQGGPGMNFSMGESYRVAFMNGNNYVPARPGTLIIGPQEEVSTERIVKAFSPF